MGDDPGLLGRFKLLIYPASSGSANACLVPLVDRVNKALRRALYDQEHDTGNWENSSQASSATGRVHGPGHTVIYSGVNPKDKIIDRAQLSARSGPKTYVVGLQVMVYAEAGRSEDREPHSNACRLVNARSM